MASWVEIFERLEKHGDPETAVGMENYMKNLFPFLGIKTPKRRELSKTFLKEKEKGPVNWDFVELSWEKEYREAQYLGMDYLLRKVKSLDFHDLPKIEALLLRKSWWDTSDVLDKLIGEIGLKDPRVDDLMLQWSQSENLWQRRVSIIHQRHRKEKTNLDLLKKAMENNLGPRDFFIEKAIGWALRDLSKTKPLWVKGFIEEHQKDLSPLSLREGSKYLY